MTWASKAALNNVWPYVQDKELLLPVHNPSQIPADFKTFIEGRDSPFAVLPREGHLEPNESMPLKAGLPGLLSAPSEKQGPNLGSALHLKLQDAGL